MHAVFDRPTARPLSNSEALQVLNQTQQMRKDDDAAYVPTPMVQQTKQYLERFNSVKSIQAIEAMQQYAIPPIIALDSKLDCIWGLERHFHLAAGFCQALHS